MISRKLGVAVALAAATMSVAPVRAGTTSAIIPTEQTLVEERKAKRMRQAVATGSLAKRIRSRGPQAKPKRRPNRNHISKRVRRKHRRAA